MKKLLSIFILLLALLAFLPSSLGVRIRAYGVTVRSAPSSNSAVLKFFPLAADLQVSCQRKGWSRITGRNIGSGVGWAMLNGGKEVKGVPNCDAPPKPLPKIPGPIPRVEGPILPEKAPSAPCHVAPHRPGIADAAKWAVRSKQNITYTQNASRWSGINEKACPFLKVPSVADSSSFVTWLFWTAFGEDRDFLHNQNWKGGNIETLRNNSFPTSLAGPSAGDLVFYGKAPHDHVAIYVGGNQVVSFEESGPAMLLPINYRGSDYIVRSYFL